VVSLGFDSKGGRRIPGRRGKAKKKKKRGTLAVMFYETEREGEGKRG